MMLNEFDENQHALISAKIFDLLKFVWNPTVLSKTDFFEKCANIYVKQIINLSVQERSDLLLKYLQKLSVDVYEDQAAYLRCEHVCYLILSWFKSIVPSKNINIHSDSEVEKLQIIFNRICYKINKIPCQVNMPFKDFLPYVKFENTYYHLIYMTENIGFYENKTTQSMDQMMDWYIDIVVPYLENAAWANSTNVNDSDNVEISISPQFMYCKTLNYKDIFGEFSITVEQSPDGSILVWVLDIPRADVQRQIITQLIVKKLSYTNIIFIDSHRV